MFEHLFGYLLELQVLILSRFVQETLQNTQDEYVGEHLPKVELQHEETEITKFQLAVFFVQQSIESSGTRLLQMLVEGCCFYFLQLQWLGGLTYFK